MGEIGTFLGGLDRAETAAPAEGRLVWALVSGRSGDDAQCMRVVKALGWPYRVLRVKPNVPELVVGRIKDTFRAPPPADESLRGDGPWPDLLVAVGGRALSFARQVRTASGGKTRLVFLGAPLARLDDIDLIITTPQWRLPARPNVIHTLLPLNWPAEETLARAARHWEARLGPLPRPWLGVSVGGSSSSFAMRAGDAVRLARRINAVCEATGGSALITTSRRTPAAVADGLAREVRVPNRFTRWTANGLDNPYLGYLALADRFIVTNDSASMIADALRTGRPVELYKLRQRAVSRLLTHPWIAGADGADATQYAGTRPAERFRRWLIESGWWTPARNLPRLARMLEERGLLGEGAMPLAAPFEEDLERTITRIRGLFPTPAEETVLSRAA